MAACDLESQQRRHSGNQEIDAAERKKNSQHTRCVRHEWIGVMFSSHHCHTKPPEKTNPTAEDRTHIKKRRMKVVKENRKDKKKMKTKE